MASLTTELNVATFPKVLKPILPFLQRANDFEKRAPLVAFYCRTYAAQLGITIIQSGAAKEDGPTKMLIDLMDKLEIDKQSLDANTEDGRATVELFAIKMFKKADDADRAGRHDAIVARLFYASSVLMEVTKQFGDLSEDIVEKQKYARWKAAEISRAIKTGSSIAPGPYGSGEETGYEPEQESETEMGESHQQQLSTKQTEYRHTSYEQPQPTFNQQQDNFAYQQNTYDQTNNNQMMDSDYNNNQYDQQQGSSFGEPNHSYDQYFQQEQQPSYVQPPPQQSFAPPPVSPPTQQFFAPPPQPYTAPPQKTFSPPPQPFVPPPQQSTPKPQVQTSAPKPQTMQSPSHSQQHSFQIEKEEVPLEDVMKAQKFTKFATSSLQFNDIESAKKYLRDALQLIGG